MEEDELMEAEAKAPSQGENGNLGLQMFNKVIRDIPTEPIQKTQLSHQTST
jgi:hypothetical protein